jgi:hypothetical protein
MAQQSFFRRRSADAETVTGVEARAGFLDRPVLVVLTVSLVLIAVIFGAMLLGFW